jgi:formylmethanofuran dehydrogenase subunit A
MGLPNLRGLDALKVELANKLYWATNKLVKLALSLNIRVSIENPTNSLFLEDRPNGGPITILSRLHEQLP